MRATADRSTVDSTHHARLTELRKLFRLIGNPALVPLKRVYCYRRGLHGATLNGPLTKTRALQGGFHARNCIAYGATWWPGLRRDGASCEDSVPVFNSAMAETAPNMALIFVPPPFAADAIVESADAGIPLIACITEGVPGLDMVRVARYLEDRPVRLIGPNCPGLINPGARCKVGIMPGAIHLPGRVGIVSRSGTLTYEAVGQLTGLGLGQSTCVGIGGDPIIGTSFVEVLRLFQEDDDTDAVVLIGEIGGSMEQDAAAYVKEEFTKPISALVVGASAPPGKRMGHAGAIITGESATAEAKVRAFREAGATIIPTPADIGSTTQAMLQSAGLLA